MFIRQSLCHCEQKTRLDYNIELSGFGLYDDTYTIYDYLQSPGA